MPRRTQDTTSVLADFAYRACTFCGRAFNPVRLSAYNRMSWSYNPRSCLVWASPISLATTLGIIGLFSFPPGTKMFQFPGLSPHKLCIGLWVTALFNAAGFPHSDTPGSLPVYDSPRRFAVFCVLLLLYMPRHPPYALIRLITNLAYAFTRTVQISISFDLVILSFTTTQKDLSVFLLLFSFQRTPRLACLFLTACLCLEVSLSRDPSKPNRNQHIS